MINIKYLLRLCPLERAKELATIVHEGQVDKAGHPYIAHPLRVADMCMTEEQKIVALLHDTIEDTALTPEHLTQLGFTKEVIEAVLSVTKREDEDYCSFVSRAKLNPIGRVVKLNDIKDNLDLTRLKSINETDLTRINKYIQAYHYLME